MICSHGIYEDVYVLKSNHNPVKVDMCIAREIDFINNKLGIVTLGSCCGHGYHDAIALIDEKSFSKAKKFLYEPKKYFYVDGTESNMYEIKLKGK